MKTLFIALRALLFASGFIFLWGWVALSLHQRYDSAIAMAPPSWTQPAGVAMMVVGGILAITCLAMFVVRGEGTAAPFDPPRKFVAVGPYRFVRNPMYVGGFTVLFGLGLYEQSPAILLLTLPFLVCAHLFVVLYEEPRLRVTFGDAYNAYCRSVHRWRPGRFRPA